MYSIGTPKRRAFPTNGGSSDEVGALRVKGSSLGKRISQVDEKVNNKNSGRDSVKDSEYLELAKNPEKNEARLREMVRLQRKQTNCKVITPSSVNTVAKRIYKETGATGNVMKIKNRNIITGEHPAPIAVRYGNDVSITNPTTLATESQDKKSNRAAMSTERIDYLIEDSGAGMRKDYAQSWITSINPTDFLNMTLGIVAVVNSYKNNGVNKFFFTRRK